MLYSDHKKTRYRHKKIFTNHISNAEVISRIYKQFSNLNSKKKKQTLQLQNIQKMNRHFTGEAPQMANKHMKGHLASLSIKGI